MNLIAKGVRRIRGTSTPARNTVGPTIMRYGTEEQKRLFLPPILNGELNIAIGYTEPGAGCDLASLRTKAVRDGDHYVINGQKIFTSLAGTSGCAEGTLRVFEIAKKRFKDA